MNDYPPGKYIAEALQSLPPPGPDLPPQTVEIDARPVWGRYRITFIARQDAQGAGRPYWFWAIESGKRL